MTPLRAWLASRLAVALLVVATLHGTAGFLAGWDSWDVTQLREIAQFGYDGFPDDYADEHVAAFFPGFPLVLHLVHLVVPDWTAAGLVVSLLAGAVAASYLGRLADEPGWAVASWVLSPYAVFLFAGYSEALFLALALPGWHLAKHGRWGLAAVLVAGAGAVRVNGLFLAVALVVLWLTSGRPTRGLGWLVVPFLPVVGYAAYLRWLTGDWFRWLHAQRDGWGRHLSWPWDALDRSWALATDSRLPAEYLWSARAELVAVAVGVGLTALLLRQRGWGEATYVGLSVAALATSTTYLSVGRATLLWFPLWVLLGGVLARSSTWRTAYLCTSVPLMAAGVLTFHAGRWVG